MLYRPGKAPFICPRVSVALGTVEENSTYGACQSGVLFPPALPVTDGSAPEKGERTVDPSGATIRRDGGDTTQGDLWPKGERLEL